MHGPTLFSVLVVDDESDILESTVAFLRLSGFKVAGARGGREAIEAAQSDPPDVALVDLSMPDVDGFEVARRLRATSPPPFLVAVTGLGADWDRQRAANAGFVLYITKPVDPDKLVTLVRQCGQARVWK